MPLRHFDHPELLDLLSDKGVIRLAGQRVILLDTVALGIMRKHLIENIGLAAARSILTQLGFAHGWRMADAMREALPWTSIDEWRQTGPRIHSLAGFFALDPASGDSLSPAGLSVKGSYEAEQHLLHTGKVEAPVCWTICGIISGYQSRATGQEIYVLEDRCMGKGDDMCRFLGRTRQEWGEERKAELDFFEPRHLSECLDISLHQVAQSLKSAERKLRQHQRALRNLVPEVEEPLGIIAKSPMMRQLVDVARRVAQVDSTVLLLGETGAGKERIARFIHDESTRALGPFIAINCSAITETLLESELFGHARGAFTGATQDRPGLFEAANGGTLLLDEVGEVSAAMQAKLLRVIQEREIRRVGENKNRSIDVRILTATHRDLSGEVAAGRFRQDLYYRLKVVELNVPPLRNRREDILPLARVLLAGAAIQMKRPMAGLSPAAADQLQRYNWPGNVRELENVMERAVALALGERVELEDLPEEVRSALPRPIVTPGAVRPLEEIEREYILASLELNQGNQTQTAAQLQIGSATLYRKLKAYGVLSNKMRARVSAQDSASTSL